MVNPDMLAFAAETDAIVTSIRPLLADRSPMVSGFVLAELLGMWLAAFEPKAREEMLHLHIVTACALASSHDQRSETKH